MSVARVGMSRPTEGERFNGSAVPTLELIGPFKLTKTDKEQTGNSLIPVVSRISARAIRSLAEDSDARFDSVKPVISLVSAVRRESNWVKLPLARRASRAGNGEATARYAIRTKATVSDLFKYDCIYMILKIELTFQCSRRTRHPLYVRCSLSSVAVFSSVKSLLIHDRS